MEAAPGSDKHRRKQTNGRAHKDAADSVRITSCMVRNPSIGPAPDRGRGPETANFRPVRDSGAAIPRVAPMSDYIVRTARNRVVPSTTR